jgi:hypothetical protein
MLDRVAFNLADISRIQDTSKPAQPVTSQIPVPVSLQRQVGKVSANSGARLTASAARVKSNHGAVVPASGQSQNSRITRRDSRVAATPSGGILQTSATSTAPDDATLTRWQSTPAVKRSEKPGVLNPVVEEQQALEAAPAPVNEVSMDRVKTSAAGKRSLHNRSFLKGLGVAGTRDRNRLLATSSECRGPVVTAVIWWAVGTSGQQLPSAVAHRSSWLVRAGSRRVSGKRT